MPTKATAPTSESTSQASFSLAGFQVTIIGRFWVTPEGKSEPTSPSVPEPIVDPPLINSDYETLPNVDLSKRPLIAGHIGQSVACLDGVIAKVYLMISLTNRGIPSSLGGWRLHYMSKRLKQQFPFMPIAPIEGCAWKGRTFAFRKEDSIYERTMKRVETGAMVRGWAKYEVPGFLFDEIGTKHAQLSLHMFDYQTHEYVLTWIGTGVEDTDPTYYPGVNPTEIPRPTDKP